MKLFLFALICFFTYFDFQSAQSCYVEQNIETYETFPQYIFMSYNENRNYSLKEFWNGVNITYSVNELENITITEKLVNTSWFSFANIIENSGLGEISDIYWDDKSISSQDDWANSSYLVILTYNGSNYN